MKVSIIVDGGKQWGMGHVVRGMALAEELASKAEILFATKSDDVVVDYIKDAGFSVSRVGDDKEMIPLLRETKPNIVVIDRIDMPEELARELRENLDMRLVMMDSISGANRYADIVVNTQMNEDCQNKAYFDNETETFYFSGLKYAVLRKEFYQHRKQSASLGKPRRILLIFGASDPLNLTSVVLDELLGLEKDYEIDIVLGVQFDWHNELNKVLAKYPHGRLNVRIYQNTLSVAELMHDTDLVITSPGISIYEALCVRVPVIPIYQNELQRDWFDKFLPTLGKGEIEKLGGIISDGDYANPFGEYISSFEVGDGKAEVVRAILNPFLGYTQKQKGAYEEYLARQDPDSPEASHWLGKGKLWLRFEVLTQIGDLQDKSMLDFGCGNGLLVDFLRGKGIDCAYEGWDISEKMIEVARKRHPTARFKVCDILSEDVSKHKGCFDYIIVNGVFNLLVDSNRAVHWGWVKETLRELWTMCKQGMGVSFMTEYVDWEDKELYYCSVDAITSFCVRELSRWFMIRHDYKLWEFTIYVYRDSWLIA